jgi:integrase
MAQYNGISKKKMIDGSTSIMVRFKHQGMVYPIKNFTKLFGCTTEKQGFEKLNEVKNLISKGKDPFSSSISSLNQIFENSILLNLKNKVWTASTIKTYKYFYDRHIKPVIGKRKIEKISYEDIMKILNNFTNIQSGSKNKVIDILRPIFKEELNKGHIFTNVMDRIDKYTVKVQREDLSKRTNHNYTNIVRDLYDAIPKYNQAKKYNIEQHQIFLYLLLMTGHRFGELNQLEKKHCNIEECKIVSPSSITKTQEDYHFPIPEECIDYIKNHQGGKLFNVPRGGTASRIFHRLLIKANIKTIDDHSISMHDTRKLMLSIMISKLGIDSRLADYCLDHKPQGTIKHYLEFTYEDKVNAYNKYWNYIRNIVIEEPEIIKEPISILNKNNISNFDKLKELVDMVKNGFITKEQFELERDSLYND